MGFTTNSRHMERSNQFVGQSLAFLDAVERASRAAPLNRPVLVIGERGTGKELIAERLHHLSPRWSGPLVTMNCAALPENLIEAELFGHEAGSFTGAAKTRHGRFEEADGGTLFLDELATLSSPAQDRLLRAVEYGEVTRIGASKPISVDVRIVAATNEHLPRAGRPGPVPRRPARPAVVRGGDPAAAAGAQAATFRCSPNISAGAWRSSSTGRTGPASRRAWSPSSRPIPGRATCASCATSSSARCIAPRIPSGAIDQVQFDPFESPWATGRGCRRRPPRRASRWSKPGGARAPAATRPRRRRAERLSLGGRRLRALAARGRAGPKSLQPAGDRRRAGLSYDQLRHALKRHKLQDSAA